MTHIIGSPQKKSSSKIFSHAQAQDAVVVRMSTRKLNDIENITIHDKPDDGVVARVRGYIKDFNEGQTGCVHRTKNPTFLYNCHGLTFASRRAAINNPSEVQKILDDDNYQELETGSVLIGDIIIYYDTNLRGEISHSGIVVEVPNTIIFNPRILSKWGDCHEVIHYANQGPWGRMQKKYFRMFPW